MPFPQTIRHFDRPTRVRFAALCVASAAALCADAAWQAPLSGNERVIAESLALSHRQAASLAPRLAARDATHPLGVQVLSVVPLEQKNSGSSSSRAVKVYTFDHESHSARLTVVDLSSGRVTSSARIEGVHLPLSDDEIAFSVKIAREHDGVQSRLRAEHTSPAHDSGTDYLSGLQLRVAVWVPTHPEHAGNSQCDDERCALISLFDTNNISYATEPVVNFRTGQLFLDLIQ